MLLLVLFIGIAGAQESSEVLLPGQVRLLDLQANQPIFLTFEGQAGQVVNLTFRSLEAEGEIDTVLEIRDRSGDGDRNGDRRLAYNDNHRTGRDDLYASDSAITGVRLPAHGRYTVRLDSYGSIGVGRVEVLLEVVDLFETMVQEGENGDLMVSGVLPRWQVFRYTVEAEDGALLTITARDRSGTLDPYLRLFDANGRLIASNDDHGTGSVTLDVLDAQIQNFEVAVSDEYSLALSDLLGRAGRFEVAISRSES
ncbi:MAG: hypothetical protein SF029_03435 [bacterium]|nr:hypothetical protein [bacterium]